MRTHNGAILFDSNAALLSFISDLELVGLVRFKNPVVDQSDCVLVREKIFVRQSMLERLSEVADKVKYPICLEITDEVLTRIKMNVAGAVLRLSARPDQAMLLRIYRDLPYNHRPIVLGAFRDRRLALLSFRIKQQKPALFEHLALLGLLTLGIMLQQDVRIPLLRRHAFLAGFLSLIGLADTDQWATLSDDDAERKRRLERSAVFIDQMRVVDGLGSVLRNSYYSKQNPEVVEEQFGDLLEDFTESIGATPVPPDETAVQTNESQAAATGLAPSEDSDFPARKGLDGQPETADDTEDETEEDPSTPEAVHPEAAALLTEVARIARFVYESILSAPEKKGAAETMVHQLAYNTARGFFNKQLVSGALARFKEYETDVRYLQAVAAAENRCLHGNHAWAYPKPRATQVLCSSHMLACPYINGGWKFTLVSPQQAFGRIGKELPPTTYHKCLLEEELPAPVADLQLQKKKIARQAAASAAME